MAGEHYSGQIEIANGGAWRGPAVVDQAMLDSGQAGQTLRDELTQDFGEEGWTTMPHTTPSRWTEKMAASLRIPLYEVVVLSDGEGGVHQKQLH